MPERKSGPVKPPILDLEARKNGQDGASGKPSAAETASRSQTAAGAAPKPDAAKSDKPARSAATTALIAGGVGVVGGAAIGFALSYGFAVLGWWPQAAGATTNDFSALSARVAKIEQETGAAISGLAAFNQRVSGIEDQGTKSADTLSAKVAELGQRLDALPTPASQTELAALESRVKDLSGRIDAIAAGASSGDASAMSARLTGVETDIADLRSQLAGIETQVGAAQSETASVRSQLSALAAQPSAPDTGSLPLALSAFEAALRDGQPFATELKALTASLPQLQVSDALGAAAATGLARPDLVAHQLDAAIPAMLAAQPLVKGSGWGEMALDRLKGLLAMRPAGETEGDTPAAIVSRLEAAVGRQDFVSAATLMQSLPQPMIAAAGRLPDELAALGDAYALLRTAREQALAQAAGAAR